MTNFIVRVGDVVRYSPFGGGVRRVLVDTVEDEWGRKSFTGRLLDRQGNFVPAELAHEIPSNVWGYVSQVIGFGL